MPNPYQDVEERAFLHLLFIHYLTNLTDLTIAKLQKELLKEAKDTSTEGLLPAERDVRSSGISPSMFFQKAIELED